MEMPETARSKKPIVSVIVPIYNVEKYVEQCLDSLANQTYKNMQILLINDGSTDSSMEKALPYLSDTRFKLKSQTNQGLAAARNRGLKSASGRYVMFVDADDYVEPNMVEQLVLKMEQSQADLIRFNADAFTEEESHNQVKQNQYDFSHRLEPDKIYEGKEALRANRQSFTPSACLYMVKRSIIAEHRISFPKDLLHEDEWFTTMIFLYAQKMAYINEAFYHRRYRASSIMTERTAARDKKSFDSYHAILKKLQQFLQKEELDADRRKFVKRQQLSIYSGLQDIPVSPDYKKEKMGELFFITWRDKLFLRISRWKNQHA